MARLGFVQFCAQPNPIFYYSLLDAQAARKEASEESAQM